jgi:hypothetical protein
MRTDFLLRDILEVPGPVQRNAFSVAGPFDEDFPARLCAEANRLGLRGHCERSGEGLHGIVEGPEADVEALFDWCVCHASATGEVVPAVVEVTDGPRTLPPFEERPEQR